MDHNYQNHRVHENDVLPAGFRLARLEVYNWGTFNHNVWVLSPRNGTALLTGANASGKSTLVDALLTLLVPYLRRTYNQASGTEKRRERDERTYILGAWSKQKDSTSSQARPEYLRDKSSYSVLLAVFQNVLTKRDVTLAQVLRVQDEVEKFFVVASSPLSIAEHFRLTGTLPELRKQLKAQGAEVFTDFAPYSRRFRQLVNVRSEKAFDLFNQTVSLKEIGGLNTFVREHMLERTNTQARISQLRTNFENLTRTHDAILLAQTRLEILEPLMKNADKYAEQQAKMREAQRCSELVPVYIAARKAVLLEEALADAGRNLGVQRKQLTVIEEDLKRIEQQRIDLHVAIRNDQIGQQIAQLNQQVTFHTDQQKTKQAEANKYNVLVRSLGLAEYSDEEVFYATRQQAAIAHTLTTTRLENLKDERDTSVQKRTQVEQACIALQADIASLKQRKSQIPTPDIALRRQIVDALHIEEEDIPFAGELVRVRTTEQRWEAAAERLLHGFALQLLVPEQHYFAVSRFVEKTHLGRRVVYHRVGMSQRTPRNSVFPDANMLYNKLEIKADTPFSAWLSADIIDRYDYLCCETLEEFQQARRALTVHGQIKHNPTHHEKDDRKQLGDRTSYVLGWNNREKLQALETELSQQARSLSTLTATVKRIEQEQRLEQTRQQNLQRLLEFENFAGLNWTKDERIILELKAQISDLEKNTSLATLQARLREVEQELASIKEKASVLRAASAKLELTISQYTVCDRKRQSKPEDALPLASIEKEYGRKELTLKTIDEEESILTTFYGRRVSSLQGTITPLGQQIVLQMEAFRQTSPVIAQEVDASIAATAQYRRYYEQTKREDLPRHSKRFKELLNDNVIIDINSFKAGLEQQEKEIEMSIEKLNSSLNTIDYTPLTYIELRSERTHDQEVREFKNELRACLPDVSQQRSAESNEASFQRIRVLLQRFEQDERWTARVTDVRNWLDFSAEELYREDGKRKNYYSDSSGKSGGQKTKLAYTILASAIAYQYGLDQEEGRERTFRFVVVDEAFSKSDETNARYAMELFKQLDLQLLVVTPLDKIHIIEPYISACHYVVNTEEENDSRVYNLTIKQYHEQKQAIQAGALIHDYAD